MEVIVRLQDRKQCVSITCMMRHYADLKGAVIFDHRHNAALRYVAPRVLRGPSHIEREPAGLVGDHIRRRGTRCY